MNGGRNIGQLVTFEMLPDEQKWSKIKVARHVPILLRLSAAQGS